MNQNFLLAWGLHDELFHKTDARKAVGEHARRPEGEGNEGL